MTIPPWQLILWKPVLASLPEFRRLLGKLRPYDAAGCDRAVSGGGLREGQTLWVASLGDDRLGLAWDWAEVREHVVALRDPMSVLSNVCLLDERGERLDEAHRIVHLNSALHELDWQRHVRCGPVRGMAQAMAA